MVADNPNVPPPPMDEGVRPVSPQRAKQIDQAMGLQMISIRLPVSVIEDFKLVAKIQKTLYQPLMRDALVEWIDRKKTAILRGLEYDQREGSEMHKADKLFTATYRYADATWSVEIWADDWQDAERKLRALQSNGRIDGEDSMRIKLPTWSERFLRFLGFGDKA